MGTENRLLFIFNPRSGKGQIKSKLAEIIDTFTRAGMEVTVHPTQHAKDAIEVIQQSGAEYEIVVAAGGDGTLNESFQGLMEIEREKRPYFGYIPTGSTNDFAATLHISKNPEVAAKGIVEGKKFWCDVGKSTTGYFAYVAAFGAFTNVSYATSQESKNTLGHLAYILEGIKNLTNLESYTMQVAYQDETGQEQCIEDAFIYGMVCNTRSVAGMNLGNESEIDLQDGLFEALLVKHPRNPIELQQTINALLTRDFSSERFYFFHTDAIRMCGEKEVSWTLDGEYGGTLKKMEIINIPKAIRLRYQAEKKRFSLRLSDKDEES